MALSEAQVIDHSRHDAASWARRIGTHYWTRKLLKALLTVFVVASVTFWLVHLMPGNPVDVYVNAQVQQGIPYAQARQQAASLFAIKLDEPLWKQYFGYLGELARGNLGYSAIRQGTPVSEMILTYLPWTLFSVGLGLFISFSVGVLLGIVAAYKRESLLDHLLTNLLAILQAVPNYIVAILILIYFGVHWEIIDIAAMRGTLSPGVHASFSLRFVGDVLYHALLPVTVYVLTSIGGWMLAMRASTESTLNEDYVTAGRTRGLSTPRLAVTYVGRNSMLPLFSQLMIAIGFSVGGSVLIEVIFSYQGIGMMLTQAVNQRDYPVIQGILLVITISVVVVNLLADVLYGQLDPRVRVEGGQ